MYEPQEPIDNEATFRAILAEETYLRSMTPGDPTYQEKPMKYCECGHEIHAHDHEGITADWCVWCSCDGLSRPAVRSGGGPVGFLLAVTFAMVLFGAAIWVLIASA
jgi:hypothetical protein